LPSTFFPEIDESMERIYVRLAPGISLREAAKKIQQMGQTLVDKLPPGNVELMLTNVGSPNNARSAMTSPNQGPHMGFIRLALADAEKRTLSQRELADRSRAILNHDFRRWSASCWR
jgi:multidrug efflux pump subunit AcrB